MELDAIQGDISRADATAIVNAANEGMRGGGGVDGAIHRAAGPRLLDELIERFPYGLPTGEAGWSHGHDLPARFVIHVVGPVHDGTGGNRHLLESCYSNALAVADGLIAENGIEDFTLALPLVSAGVYGWPKDDAIRCAIDTLRATPTEVVQATLVAFDGATLRRIESAL